MSETAAGAPHITGKLFLFEQPELLSKEAHAHLGMNPPAQPFAFAAKIRAVPITVSEFANAMKHYPIVFTAPTNIVPLAVVGVIDDVNLFIDENGNWDPEAYVPAYLRRYPFAFASEPSGERFALVIDRAFSAIAPNADMPFFTDGVPTEATNQAIDFCKRFEADRIQTEQAMKALEAFDIVTGHTAQYSPPGGGEQRAFAQYFAVDPNRFDALTDDRFLELRKTGLIPALYAQLMSLANWRTLLARRARRYNLTGPAIFEPAPLS
jgi:hypothetical protein